MLGGGSGSHGWENEIGPLHGWQDLGEGVTSLSEDLHSFRHPYAEYYVRHWEYREEPERNISVCHK